jgi:hypothetical protein
MGMAVSGGETLTIARLASRDRGLRAVSNSVPDSSGTTSVVVSLGERHAA